ncbi:hypothetical protein [Lysobacter sp. Root983]|uniref:hypothetical protein n=1 Tax=Lysobacter sp. Root983 TaxID=1736613 RepID=UPI000710A16E|nr:hypothetical protein [Lysobacter sp. Root983]KRD76033.1 hypothetical protein ASE43_14580 [Lysobacter sp. Root983]
MNHTDDIHELAGLLPFYANGRLDAEQRARIDAALATMPELRAELAEVREFQAQIQASGQRSLGAEPASPADRLRKLQARIAAETADSNRPVPLFDASTASAPAAQETAQPARIEVGAPAAQTSFGSRRPRYRPWLSKALAAGLALVCMVQAVMLYRLRSDGENAEYASLSGPTDRAAAAGVRFSLRLRADAPWSDVQALCEQLNLRIVDGPEDGMIDVAPTDGLDAAQIEAIEAALKRSPSVAFVGRQG